MYDYVDRDIGALDTGSRFLIWAMRGWVQTLTDGHCPPAALGPAFARSGMLSALPHFHVAMIVLNREGKETLAFALLACARVSEDEAIILSLVRAIGADRMEQARATIALLVLEDSVGTLLRALSAFVIHLGARFPDDKQDFGIHRPEIRGQETRRPDTGGPEPYRDIAGQ